MNPVALGTYSRRQVESEMEQQVDSDSIKGHFGWTTIDGLRLPCIFRNGIKYVCERIVNVTRIGKYHKFEKFESQMGVYRCFATCNEAKLLDEINQVHCCSAYGPKPFTEQDIIMPLKQFEQSYNLMTKTIERSIKDVKKSTLDVMGGRENNTEVCGGFYQVENVVIPYIKRSEDILLPLGVLQNSAKLLTTVDNGTYLTVSETRLLNIICERAGFYFIFSSDTVAVKIEVLLFAHPLVRVSVLPLDSPLSRTEYLPPLYTPNPNTQPPSSYSTGIDEMPRNMKVPVPNPIHHVDLGDRSSMLLRDNSNSSRCPLPKPVHLNSMNSTAYANRHIEEHIVASGSRPMSAEAQHTDITTSVYQATVHDGAGFGSNINTIAYDSITPKNQLFGTSNRSKANYPPMGTINDRPIPTITRNQYAPNGNCHIVGKQNVSTTQVEHISTCEFVALQSQTSHNYPPTSVPSHSIQAPVMQININLGDRALSTPSGYVQQPIYQVGHLVGTMGTNMTPENGNTAYIAQQHAAINHGVNSNRVTEVCSPQNNFTATWNNMPGYTDPITNVRQRAIMEPIADLQAKQISTNVDKMSGLQSVIQTAVRIENREDSSISGGFNNVNIQKQSYESQSQPSQEGMSRLLLPFKIRSTIQTARNTQDPRYPLMSTARKKRKKHFSDDVILLEPGGLQTSGNVWDMNTAWIDDLFDFVNKNEKQPHSLQF